LGTIRCNFASNYQNSNNGFNLGSVSPVSDTTNTGYAYLECNTIQSRYGCTMSIPNTNSEFNVSLFDLSETLMLNVPDYQIILYFDVLE
jgi:hypothetical protein